MLLTFENLSRILRLEPASRPQNLRAEPQKLERVTPRSSPRRERSAVFIRSREQMVQGTNSLANESSRERMVQGTNVPGNEWSRERKFHHGNECSRERIVLRTNIPAFVLADMNVKLYSWQLMFLQGQQISGEVAALIPAFSAGPFWIQQWKNMKMGPILQKLAWKWPIFFETWGI